MSENPPSAEAQHGKRRRRPAWLILLLIILFLLISLLCCWLVIWPIINPPATATDEPVPIDTATETATPTATATETATPTATCIAGTEGCDAQAPDPTETETETPTPTATEILEPPDLVVDPISPEISDEWDTNCSSYSISVNVDVVARNQGESPSSSFTVSLGIFNEPNQAALSNVVNLNFGAIEAGASESQAASLTVTITKGQITNGTLYIIIQTDINNQVAEIDETNNRIEHKITVPSCGKKGG